MSTRPDARPIAGRGGRGIRGGPDCGRGSPGSAILRAFGPDAASIRNRRTGPRAAGISAASIVPSGPGDRFMLPSCRGGYLKRVSDPGEERDCRLHERTDLPEPVRSVRTPARREMRQRSGTRCWRRDSARPRRRRRERQVRRRVSIPLPSAAWRRWAE